MYFSYRVHKSKMILTGLESKGWQSCNPSEGSKGESISWTFQDIENLPHSSILLLLNGSNDESSPMIILTFFASLLGTLESRLDPDSLLSSCINDICHLRILRSPGSTHQDRDILEAPTLCIPHLQVPQTPNLKHSVVLTTMLVILIPSSTIF